MAGKHWTKRELDILENSCSKSISDIQKLLPNRSYSSIVSKRTRAGFHNGRGYKTENHKDKISKGKINKSLNLQLFKKWSSDMAYILGFLMADGYLANVCGKYDIGIGINKKDRDILVQIKNIIGKNLKIRKRPKNIVELRFGCKKMFNDLLKLGMIPRKSLRLEFPKVPNEYLQDFIRGYFDGDGFVIIPKDNCLRVGFTGYKNFIKSLKEIIETLMQYKIGFYILNDKRNNHKLVATSEIHGTKALKFLDWLYKKANLKMNRKYQKYLEAKQIYGAIVNGSTEI